MGFCRFDHVAQLFCPATAKTLINCRHKTINYPSPTFPFPNLILLILLILFFIIVTMNTPFPDSQVLCNRCHTTPVSEGYKRCTRCRNLGTLYMKKSRKLKLNKKNASHSQAIAVNYSYPPLSSPQDGAALSDVALQYVTHMLQSKKLRSFNLTPDTISFSFFPEN